MRLQRRRTLQHCWRQRRNDDKRRWLRAVLPSCCAPPPISSPCDTWRAVGTALADYACSSCSGCGFERRRVWQVAELREQLDVAEDAARTSAAVVRAPPVILCASVLFESATLLSRKCTCTNLRWQRWRWRAPPPPLWRRRRTGRRRSGSGSTGSSGSGAVRRRPATTCALPRLTLHAARMRSAVHTARLSVVGC